MDEGGKQLGAVIIAVIVVVALIGVAKALFGDSGTLKTKIETELNNIKSSQVVYEMDMPDYGETLVA